MSPHEGLLKETRLESPHSIALSIYNSLPLQLSYEGTELVHMREHHQLIGILNPNLGH